MGHEAVLPLSDDFVISCCIVRPIDDAAAEESQIQGLDEESSEHGVIFLESTTDAIRLLSQRGPYMILCGIASLQSGASIV